MITYPRYLHHKDKTVPICLACPLPDCVGTEHRKCPLRQWREGHKRVKQFWVATGD